MNVLNNDRKPIGNVVSTRDGSGFYAFLGNKRSGVSFKFHSILDAEFHLRKLDSKEHRAKILA